MGRWALRLSVALGMFTCLFTCSLADENYCFAARAKSCSECLQAGVGCAYCPEETFNGPRCDLLKNILAHGCAAASVISEKSSMSINTKKAIDLSLAKSQVTPQQVTMSFLPGEERLLDVEVFSPIKGPLDLYILMDFSNSMADDLDNLKKMGTQLASLVEKLSDSYTIGFGKFVDKVIEPQTDMRPSKLKQPWPNSTPPFSFQNVIKLTSNVNFFTSELQKEKISGNLDAPEGGFDAILQAAVCTDKIGWREHSTHLLVFSTESAFHYESDGINVLSGILKRNDEACHLDVSGKYTEDTAQDYPSVPTLVRVLGEHNIIPIFAVTNHSYSYYVKLKEYFPIAEVGLLQEDSSNILEVMEMAFESIRSKMSIRADMPKAFEAQFMKTSGEIAQYGAFNIKPGSIGKFKMRLKAQQMLEDQPVCKAPTGDKEGNARVKPSTFSEGVNIQATVLCPTCDCEKESTVAAARCHGNGDLVCGKCQCYPGWVSTYCNCSASPSSVLDTSLCIGPDMTEPCSGRGDCLACGQCVCYNPDQFEGPYCQYDKTQCLRFGGFLCNDRGSCIMGRCVCAEGWEGSACECPISNTTCLDTNGGICNGQGKCVCGRCECANTGVGMTSTCEANFQGLLGACEATRTCVQCQAWKTGEKKEKAECDACPFKIVKVDKLKKPETVLDSCSFRDEEDDCTYHYTVDSSSLGGLEVQVLEKKECPPASLLWLLPLFLFLLLLLALLLLCCWKYCGWCKTCCAGCLALLPCCKRGRMVGFKEDHLAFHQSEVAARNYLETPMVRTGPPKGTDVVRWKITDNVHRGPNHPLAQVKPNPRENIPFPISLRLNKQFSENLTYPDSKDAEQLRKEANDSLNEVYRQIPGVHKVQKTTFRQQKNAGKREENVILDTVLTAPRSSFPDIVKLTEKNVQSGNFHNLRVVPGYYTVATDREANGAVEFQEGVESLDVRVPLFVKDTDEDEKKLQVEALDVPLGIAELGKKFVNITITKDHAPSVFSFLQDNYTFSRQDGVANIPIMRDIREDGRAQVSYRTIDHTAKDKKDYITVGGDLTYAPGETQKNVPVRLLELTERDGLLEDKQVKKFHMDLVNPQNGAKLGLYPRTTVTIADYPESSQVMFKSPSQSFSTADPLYKIPVVRTRNPGTPATVRWRTKNAQRFDLSGTLKFDPRETEKDIVINPTAYSGPVKPDNFQLELYDPGNNATLGERRTTMVNVTDGAPEISQRQQMGFINQVATSPGGHVLAPGNPRAKATGPRSIRLNWDPPPGHHLGYKVKYWIYGDPEKDATVLDVKSPQAELTNLYPYCDYEMRVCAYNALGDGHHTDVVSCQTLEDAPEPAETNGDITAYEVIYTPINDDLKPVGAAKKVHIDNPRKRMLLIENLQTAQTYQYKVRAKNKVGWGPFRDASINLASQPTRPMSIPIIPDIPIVDAEAGDEYDSFLMYSNEVLRSPGGSKTPSVAGDGWNFVKLVGSDLDLRAVSWKKQVDVIPKSRLSTDTESSLEETPRQPRPDFTMNGRWDQNFLFPGGTPSRNLSSSSSPVSTMNSSYRGGGGSYTSESTTTYLTGPGGTRRTEMIGGGGLTTTEVIRRKRSENKQYTDENIRDSIVMGEVSGDFPDLGGFGYAGTQSTTHSQFSYNLSPSSPRSAEVSRALYSLDRVLHDARSPGVPDTPSRLLLNGGEVKRLNVTNPAENSVVIQDLLPNHSYLFKVKAQSQEGWGPEREGVITIESAVDPRSPLSPVPVTDCSCIVSLFLCARFPFTLSTPSAPGPLIFTALSPDSLQLSWDKPRNPNGDILGYVVTCEQLHGGGDVRSFQVNGDSSETSLTVPNLTENVPYKFKVQARTTQGFGPEREGIITIESQDGGALTQFNSQSTTRREVFQLPTEVSTRTNVSHTMINDPYFSDGMMMTTQHTETSGMVTRHVTKEVVQRASWAGPPSPKRCYALDVTVTNCYFHNSHSMDIKEVEESPLLVRGWVEGLPEGKSNLSWLH
ncbi:hypothetical protein WMY93_010234 [Mugilogobius chulae]|uniref:Integrin beta n=1 Tax=Mugilogobius chulae TaxID=88201 RepID=A0AAW0P799_9GOBI